MPPTPCAEKPPGQPSLPGRAYHGRTVVVLGGGPAETVVGLRWVLPTNSPALAARHRLAVTAEDGLCTGGMGPVLGQVCVFAGVTTPLLTPIADVAALQVPDPCRVVYLTQTTLAVDETAEITVGLLAGASAPPALVDEVIAVLRGLAPVAVAEHTTTETLTFTPPAAARTS
ncbi:hypothetical protein [Streptomyces sp. CB02959]|uniref:hypothetical protein n=1 Tax=Streptomyces sp. CB02959 TaxID=2020330 RepID=UPI0015E06B70|nr:hypothetical protein [Streptomyces sp. CB02959]